MINVRQLVQRAWKRTSFSLTVSALLVPALLLPGNAVPALPTPPGSAAPEGEAVSAAEVNVPFTQDLPFHSAIIVHVRINGHEPLPFVLDTGVEAPLVIDEQAAREIGLQETDTDVTTEPGHVKLRSAPVSHVEIVGAETEKDVIMGGLESVYCADLPLLRRISGGGHLAGVIGMPFLETVPFTIDFHSMILTFRPGGLPRPFAHGAVVLRLVRPDPDRDRYFVPLPVGGRSVNFLWDTGAGMSEIPSAEVPALAHAYPSVASSLAMDSNVSGDTLTTAVLVRGLDLGAVRVPLASLTATPTLQTAVLGLNLLDCARLSADVPSGILVFEPAAPSTATSPLRMEPTRGFLPRATGFDLGQCGDRYCITRLIPGSPAARAGAREGDVVLDVDGRALGGPAFTDSVLGLGDRLVNARTLVNAAPGSEARLRVARGNRQMTLRFTRTNEADPATYLPSGLRLIPTGSKTGLFTGSKVGWIVEAVLADSAAGRAGLRPGDLITGVNGASAVNWDWPQIQRRLAPTKKRTVLDVRPGVVFIKGHQSFKTPPAHIVLEGSAPPKHS